jgi:NADP-dependent 3-hydroxy acid dehydrogenase YdfG
VSEPVFLITGASSGIGAATARLAAAEGYRVVLAARREALLEGLADELGRDRALAVPCDVADWDQVRSMADRALEAFGRIDVVFANAGISSGARSFIEPDASPEHWRDIVLANVYGPIITARATLSALAETNGHFVVTGSVAGRIPTPGSLYSATKWAVTAFAQNLRGDLVETGIRVSVVQPGLVDTDMVPANRKDHPKLEPSDIANAVLFAVRQPKHVDVNEIVVRPVGQVSHR